METDAGEDSRYRYRYHGLRLLAVTPDGSVLLPGRWGKGLDRAYFLRTDAETRLDVTAPR